MLDAYAHLERLGEQLHAAIGEHPLGVAGAVADRQDAKVGVDPLTGGERHCANLRRCRSKLRMYIRGSVDAVRRFNVHHAGAVANFSAALDDALDDLATNPGKPITADV